MTRECFYCGTMFSPADSMAKNTPEEFAQTYCSRRCHDLDTEQMAADGADIVTENNESNPTEVKEESTEIKVVDGFVFKIKKEK